jgi:RimJ/RimL family protein N-acetyltransferase
MTRALEFPAGGLTDGVVALRLPADADAERIAAACRDEAVARYTTLPAAYEAEHAAEWMRRGLAGMATGSELHLVVADAGTGGLLGTITLHEISRATGRAVAGYVTAPWARGRGVARRALRLVSRFAFEELRLARVELAIEPGNEPSRAAAKAAGFREEGLLRSYMEVAGARRDMVMYSLLPGDLDRPAPEPVARLEA